MNIKQAEVLAGKLDQLNDFFDITTSTIDEIKAEVDTIDIVDTPAESSGSIITISLLKQDFDFIRETLLDTVKNGRDVINKISLEIDIGESSSAGIISAYAELVGTVNNSLKLLSGTYKDIVDLHIKLEKKEEASGKTDVKGDVNITNNVITASINDIVSAMQHKK